MTFFGNYGYLGLKKFWAILLSKFDSKSDIMNQDLKNKQVVQSAYCYHFQLQTINSIKSFVYPSIIREAQVEKGEN